MQLSTYGDIDIINNKEIEEILLRDSGMRVCICIYSEFKTIDMITMQTRLPMLRVKLIMSKFMDVNMVDVYEKTNSSGIVEKYYKIVPARINVKNNDATVDSIGTIAFLSEEIGRILTSDISQKETSFVRLVTLKARSQDVCEFVKELEMLVERYIALEVDDSDETYSFISVIGQV